MKGRRLDTRRIFGRLGCNDASPKYGSSPRSQFFPFCHILSRSRRRRSLEFESPSDQDSGRGSLAVDEGLPENMATTLRALGSLVKGWLGWSINGGVVPNMMVVGCEMGEVGRKPPFWRRFRTAASNAGYQDEG